MPLRLSRAQAQTRITLPQKRQRVEEFSGAAAQPPCWRGSAALLRRVSQSPEKKVFEIRNRECAGAALRPEKAVVDVAALCSLSPRVPRCAN